MFDEKIKKIVRTVGIVLIALIVVLVGASAIMIYGQSGEKSNELVQQFKGDRKVVENVLGNITNNNFDEALITVDILLKDDAENVQLLLLKAEILLANGSHNFKEKEFALKAQDILRKVLKIDTKNVKAHRLMGYSYEIQNLFKEALVNYNKSLAIKETPEAYNWKGHTYDLMGDIFKAEEFYRKAVELDSKYQMALRNLSRVNLRLGKKNEAREILENLIKMPIDNISLVAGDYHSLGTIEFDEKNIEKSNELFRKALEIDPSFMLAQIEVAKYKILFEGKKEVAITMLEKTAQDYQKQVAPLEWLGFSYLENDELNKAIGVLKNAISLINNDITLMGEQRLLIRSRLNYYLSMAYALNGDAEMAKEHLLKIMEGTDKTTMTMLIVSLQEGEKGPYKNLMSDPDITSLADELNKLNNN